MPAACHGRKHHHHHNGKNIFQNQYAHHQSCKALLAHTQVIESLVDDGGGTHGKHSSEKHTVHLAPAKEVAHGKSCHDHAEDDDAGGNHGSHPHLQNLLEREIKSQREEQEDDTDIRPGLHILASHHRHGVGHLRTYQKTSHDIAQHQRLLQPFEEQCYDACNYQDECQVFDQFRKFCHDCLSLSKFLCLLHVQEADAGSLSNTTARRCCNCCACRISVHPSGWRHCI